MQRASEPILVYPIKKGGSGWNNNELRLSLRSVEEHWWQFGRLQIFVLSEEKLPWLDVSRVKVIKIGGYCDAILKAIELAKKHSPTGDYVWMNDDICFLKPTSPADLLPMRHQGRLSKPFEEFLPGNGWRKKVHKIRDFLAEREMSNFNFCTHLPYLFHAEWMERTIGMFGLEYKFPLETAYGNLWLEEIEAQRCRDKISYHDPHPIPNHIGHKRFLNYADRGLDDALQGWLFGLFPNASKYELDAEENRPK